MSKLNKTSYGEIVRLRYIATQHCSGSSYHKAVEARFNSLRDKATAASTKKKSETKSARRASALLSPKKGTP